jgi:HTH-type transcriptional regulator/antitoxin HipB
MGVQDSIRFKYISYILFLYRQFCNCPDAWTGKEKSKNTETRDRKGTNIQEIFPEKENETMSDLKQYINQRKIKDKEFAEGYEEGYEQFKIGVMLRHARESAGLTQEELAFRLNTRKTAISRIENHAEDIKLSTLERFAAALGKQLRLQIS